MYHTLAIRVHSSLALYLLRNMFIILLKTDWKNKHNAVQFHILYLWPPLSIVWMGTRIKHKMNVNAMYCTHRYKEYLFTRNETGICLFPDSTDRNFWGHSCSVDQLHFIQPLISNKFSALLKMAFLFRLNRRSHGPLAIRHKVFIFQIPSGVWKETI